MTHLIIFAAVLGFYVPFDAKPVESVAPEEPPIILEDEPWTLKRIVPSPSAWPSPSWSEGNTGPMPLFTTAGGLAGWWLD